MSDTLDQFERRMENALKGRMIHWVSRQEKEPCQSSLFLALDKPVREAGGARPILKGDAHLIIPRERSLENIEPDTPRIEHHIRLIPPPRSPHHLGQHLARHEVQHRVRRRVRVPVQVKVSRGVTKHVCEVVQPRGGAELAREREAGRSVEIFAAGVVSVLHVPQTSGSRSGFNWEG